MYSFKESLEEVLKVIKSCNIISVEYMYLVKVTITRAVDTKVM